MHGKNFLHRYILLIKIVPRTETVEAFDCARSLQEFVRLEMT